MPRGAKRTRPAAATAAVGDAGANKPTPSPQDPPPAITAPDGADAATTSTFDNAPAAATLAPPASPSASAQSPGACAPAPPPAPAPGPAPTPTPSKKKAKPLPASPSFKPANLEKLRAKAIRIQEQLAELYPDPPIPLHHGSAFQLLVAVMLSAQSTDAKVNTVTPELFRRGPDAEAMASLEVGEIERIIRVLGLAPTKARNVQRMSQLLVEQYGGQVPDSFPALEGLPGVGHKTASVVMSQAFGRTAFPVDTHIHRLAQRWGLSNGKSVEQTEQDLKSLLPEHTWRDMHLQMIYFGREHCPAQRHEPRGCPICSWAAPGAGGAAGAGARGGDEADADGVAAAGRAAPPARRRRGVHRAARARKDADTSSYGGSDGSADEAEAPSGEAEPGGGTAPGRTRIRGSKRGLAGSGAVVAAGKRRAMTGPGAAADAERDNVRADGGGVAAATHGPGGAGNPAAGGPFAKFRAGSGADGATAGGEAKANEGAVSGWTRQAGRGRGQGRGKAGAREVGTAVELSDVKAIVARPRTRAVARKAS